MASLVVVGASNTISPLFVIVPRNVVKPASTLMLVLFVMLLSEPEFTTVVPPLIAASGMMVA